MRPAHANRVGAPTEGNTVAAAPRVYRHPLRAGEAERRLAQYPRSSPLMTGGEGTETQSQRVRKHLSPPPQSHLSQGE